MSLPCDFAGAFAFAGGMSKDDSYKQATEIQEYREY